MNNSKKIYQENSYLTSLCSTVVRCDKKNDFYEVVLDETIFYPHLSGGQPKDEGILNNLKVIDVIEKDDEIIHVVKNPVEGSVNLKIDFEVRFDYMQQHTGQHILSFAIAKLYGGNTVGFHLGSDYTTIDIDKELNDETIEKAEIYANEIIYKNKQIKFQTLNYEEAIKLNLRKMPPNLSNFRIMEIEEIEYNACGGTHVKSTGEVGIIKVVKIEKNKNGSRIYFLCGKRALKDYYKKNNDLNDLSKLLTCGIELIYENIEKLKNENKINKKLISTLQDNLNKFYAEELNTQAIKSNDLNYIFHKYENMDIKDLKYICSKTVEKDNYVSVLISESNNLINICVGQSKNLKLDLKSLFEKLKIMLNAKGGGNNYLLQGTGDVLRGDDCLRLAKEILFEE
ncbi:MAG: alaXL [Bacillota bacterium]|jgi:alanyl-tRNA synthetase|nr:alaXL [Bacillota bacterium]